MHLGFKALCGSLSMNVSDQQRKLLRKQVSASKAISVEDFVAFVDDTSGSTSAKDSSFQTKEQSTCSLADLPSETPKLPAS